MPDEKLVQKINKVPQKPGPKPKHLKNQQSLSQFFSSNLTDTSGSSSVSNLIQDQPNSTMAIDNACNPHETIFVDPSDTIPTQESQDESTSYSPSPQNEEIDVSALNNENDLAISELNEDQTELIEETIVAIPQDGWIDKYLTGIQDKLKDGKSPECYEKGKTYWVDPGSASSVLKGNPDPVLLYKPRVFIWLPHHLTKSPLVCPS
ncbi:hypothetical protein EDC94DRAFT_695088 [Helicostylum pulchrum]|nr:hypothetical protein EDC94DRAFT_695088 [Helicostylum pulchrum]